MKPARLAVLAIALVAAVGSAMLARGLISSRPVAMVEQAAAPIDTVEVLVASKNVELGDTVAADALSWQAWPKDAARAGFIRRDTNPDAMKEYDGAIARMAMLSGEPVNASKLVHSDTAGFMSAILPEGMRAVSAKISPETGAGGFILPNDRVDVILTRTEQRSDGGGQQRHITTTVLTNIRVLAIDQAVAEQDGQKVVVGKTATLELMPNQAETLALAQSMGEIALSLRSLRDSGGASGDTAARALDGGPSGTVSMVRYGVRDQVSPGK